MNLRGGMERLSVVLAAVVGVVGLGCLAIIAFDPTRGGWPWFLAGLGAAGVAWAVVKEDDSRWRTLHVVATPWALLLSVFCIGTAQASTPPMETAAEWGMALAVGGGLLCGASILLAHAAVALLGFLADGFRQTPTR